MTVPLLYARNVNQELYVRALSSVYKSGWRVYDPDFAISKEPDPYEKVRKDPVIASAIEQRLHAVASPEWRIEPASDKPFDKMAASLIEDMLRNRLENFEAARYELAQAVIQSRAYAFPQGMRGWECFGDTTAQEWWFPTKLMNVDRRRMRLVPVHKIDPATGHSRFYIHEELFSVERDRWEVLEHPEWVIRHVYADEEARLGYGRGLLEAIYFYHYFKSIVLKEGLQGLEKWARGVMVAKIDGLRAGSADRSNDALRDSWLNVLQAMQSRHVVAADSKDDIEVVESSGEGHRMVLDFLRYLDEAITRLINGSVLPFGQSEGDGSMGRASVEQDTSEALIQYDRQLLDASLTKGLIGLIWRQNRLQFAAIGLGGARQPRFRTVHEKHEDPKANAEVAAILLGQGIPLRKDEVYGRTGWSQPGPDDEVIIKAPEPAPIPGDPNSFPFQSTTPLTADEREAMYQRFLNEQKRRKNGRQA